MRKLENPMSRTFRLLMTDRGLELVDERHLDKPEFFFKDSICSEHQFMFVGDEMWLHKVGRK